MRTDAAAGMTSYAYNAFSEVVQTTDARGNSSYDYYTIDGQLYASRDAEDYVTEFGYNAFGELTTTNRRYQRAANPAATSAPPQVAPDAKDAVTSFGYDKLGRTTTSTDAEGHTEATAYDSLGQVTRVTNTLGGTVDYTYDRRGLVTSEYVTGLVYDGAGQQTAAGYYRHVYAYDSRGNRIQDVEAQGLAEQRTTNYHFDAGNRLVATSGDTVATGLPGSVQTIAPTETYGYDARGNVILTVDAGGSRTQRYYDDLDRMIAEVQPFGAVEALNATLTTNKVALFLNSPSTAI